MKMKSFWKRPRRELRKKIILTQKQTILIKLRRQRHQTETRIKQTTPLRILKRSQSQLTAAIMTIKIKIRKKRRKKRHLRWTLTHPWDSWSSS